MRYRRLTFLALSTLGIVLCTAQDWREQEWPGVTPPIVSLEPWFDKDVRVFDERLLGKWVLQGRINEDVWRFKRGPEGIYRWSTRDEGVDSFKGRAVLARLNGTYYIDIVIHKYREYELDEPIDYPDYAFLAHQLAQLEFGEQRFRMIPLDLEQMERVIEKQRLRGAWARIGLLIVSPTEELQEFLADEGDTADIWMETDKDKWLERPQRHADSRQSSEP